MADESEGILTILAAGDLCWSERMQRQDIARIRLSTPGLDVGDWLPGWPMLPLVYRDRADLAARAGPAGERYWDESRRGEWQRIEIEALPSEDLARYPLLRIAPELRAADLTFANLETPLSDAARWSGLFRTPTSFGAAMKWAGIDVVSTANNHAYDCGDRGMLETLDVLSSNQIEAAGTGRDLAAARRPALLRRNGLTVAVLAYSLSENAGVMAFATDERSGVAPLDPELVVEDIAAAGQRADVVLLSLHWGVLDSPHVHPRQRFLAHGFLSAGADAVFGHHPHVPQGIEVVGGKVVAYSLGMLAFPHSHPNWGHNMLVSLSLEGARITRVEVVPLAGSDGAMAQPYRLTGSEAEAHLRVLQDRSAGLGTRMEIDGDLGVIVP